MKRLLSLASFAAIAMLSLSQPALAQHAEYDALVATHAQANGVPEALVHRVIVRESRYQPRLVGRGGTIGLMQIKLATARSLGYTGNAEGLRDPNTNLTYAVKYLAGAYRAANGDHNRAMLIMRAAITRPPSANGMNIQGPPMPTRSRFRTSFSRCTPGLLAGQVR